MTKKKENQSLDEALKAFIEVNHLEKGLDQVRVQEAWSRVMAFFEYHLYTLERPATLLANEQNIREVILFPMNQRAEDLMMNAPSEPAPDQLMELGLRVIPQD